MFENALEEHPFFKTLDPRLIEEFANLASKATFKAGAYLFRSGEHADRFYAIDSGEVAIEVGGGGAPIVIQTVRGGDVLGWSWLFPPYRWHLDARAATPVRALAFDAAKLRDRCEEDHELGYELMRRIAQVMTQRLQAERQKILDMSGKRA